MQKLFSLIILVLMLVSAGCNNPNGGSVIRRGNAPFLQKPTSFSFSVIRAQNGAVSISWQESKRVSTYEFFMGTSSSDISTPVPECSGVVESCQLTGLDPNTTYYLRAMAINDAGSTPVSSIATVLSVGTFNITSSSAGDSSISLSWGNAQNATSYNILYGTASGLYRSSISNVTSPYTLTGLTNGQRYYVRVVGINGLNGYSTSANEINLQPFGPLPAPSGLSLVATAGQIVLDWNDSPGATEYKIFKGTSSGSLTQVPGGPYTASTYTDNDVTNGQTYFYSVVAFNGFNSPQSTVVSAKPIANFAMISATPTPGPSQITVNWNGAVTGADSFDIQYGTNPLALSTVVSNVTSPYTFSGLTPNLTYYFRVVARNSIGSGTINYSTNQLSASPFQPLPTPTGLVVSASPGQVVLDWSDVATASEYKIYKGTSSGALSLVSGGPFTSSTFTDTSVTNGQIYYYAIRASNGSFDSNLTSEVAVKPISGLSLTSASVATFSSADITWTPALGADAYDIRYGTTSGNYTSISSNRTSTATLTGLTGGTTYYVVISARNATGAGTIRLSNELSFTTTATFPTVTVNATPTINNANQGSYSLSGTCSENGRAVTITIGSVTATPTCTALNWSATMDLTSVADSPTRTITVVHTNSGGNSDTETRTVIKDATNPTVAITTFPNINNLNKSSYTISGTCSENTRTVSVSIGGIGATPTCTALAWTVTVDATSLSDGNITLSANHSDAVGNTATQATRSITKDVTPPSVAISSSPVINNANKNSYTFSGTCSETGENVTVKVGSTTGTVTCLLLSWSATLNVSANADSPVLLITADQTDASGNTATQASTLVLKDTVNPNIVITSSPLINNANKFSYVVSGTCSENSQLVTINVGGISATPTCLSLAWSATLDVSSLADSGSIAVSAGQTDSAGNLGSSTVTVTKNTNLPTVSISSAPTIFNGNKASYNVAGACSENGRSVSINVGGISATATCSTGAWSKIVDVTAVADNSAVFITANHSDAVGNNAVQASTTTLKDTINPTVTLGSSPVMNNANKSAYPLSGTCSEADRDVTVTIGAVSATVSCESLTWTAALNISTLTDGPSIGISVAHSDAAGNQAAPASATVIKDTTIPTVAITSYPTINNSNKNAYTISGTCSENSRVVTISVGGLSSTPTCTSSTWTATLNVSGLGDNNSIPITADHTDNAGNTSTQASRTVIKDTTNPTVAFSSTPVINSTNTSSYLLSGTCSENGRLVNVNVGGVSTSSSCSSNSWTTSINVTVVSDSSSVTVTANHSDANGNLATQISTSVLKDTVLPLVAITSAPDINGTNVTSYPISGTCSENTRVVSVSVGGVTATPACNTGAWSAIMNVSGLADGSNITVTANHSDSAGNNSAQASDSVNKATSLPTVSISSLSAINNSNKASFPVSGTCSENTRVVSISVGGVTATPTCSAGTWATSVNVSGIGDNSSVAVTVDHSDAVGNNAIQASTTILKDTVLPTVSISSAGVINNANKTNYSVSGTCSENTRSVSINIGGVTGSATCTALAFSTTLNVTAVADSASVSISADHADSALNNAIQATASVLKDTSAPTVTISSAPVINNSNKNAYLISGTCTENSSTVSVNVGGVMATPSCTTGTWSATLNVSAISDSASVSVTANHSDASGNAAVQASTNVIKDTSAPTISISSNTAINNSNKAAYPINGTCSENSRTVSLNVGGISASPVCSGGVWSSIINVSSLGDNASISATADHSDSAGNSAIQATQALLKDTIIPMVAITSAPTINNTNKAAYPVSGTCSEEARTVTVNIGSASATPTCSSGAWSITLDVTSVPDSLNLSVTADQTDLAGNHATTATLTVVKDTNVPTVAINSSPIINNANKTAYTVSGTCSENSRAVNVNIGGLTFTPSCSAGSWSTGAVDVSSLSDSASVSITANHTDVNNNNAPQVSSVVLKDTNNPVVAITVANNINNSNETSYTLSGTCSENSRAVAVSVGGVATSTTCTMNAWTAGPFNVSAAADSSSLLITANHADSAGNSASQASANVIKDTANPIVAITSSSVINNSNKSNYVVSGTCSETGLAVNVNVGSVNATDTCTLLTWTVTVDVSGNPDSSTLLITADHSDASGNSALQAGITVVKDTVNPTVTIASAPSINNANRAAYTVSGSCSENSRTVSINIGGISASATCSSGAWTTGSVNVTAAADSGTLLITANHTDSAGNSATQASTNVIKDTSNPLVAITSAASINLANRATYSVSGTCSENSRVVSVSVGGVSGTPTCSSGAWAISLNVTSVPDSASVSVTANHTDASGNNATQASTTVLKDTTQPTVALSSTAPATTSLSPFVVRATFNEAMTGVAIGDFTITNGSASGFTVISASTYEINVTPAGAGTVSVDIAGSIATDANGNGNTAATQLSRTYVLPAVLTFAVTTTHDFGSIAIGSTADLTLVINKAGTANATSISEVGLAAPFAFKGGAYPGTGGTCGATISASCTLIVTFTPTVVGVRSDTIQLNYNNGASVQTITRDLTGTGISSLAVATRVDGPSGVMINQCIAYTINSINAGGTNANVSAAQTVNLVVNNGAGGFFSNNTCGTSITSTTIASGTSSTTIYFRATTANQNLTLVFNPASLSSTSINVNTTTTPTRIWFVTPPEMETNKCYPLAIDFTDASGIKAGRAVSVTVNLTDTGAASFYSDSNCTGTITSVVFPANTETKTVYVMNPTQQSINLTGTDAAAVLTSRTTSVSFVSSLIWWNTAYEKRIPLTISNLDQATAFSNIPVLIRLNSSRINYADLQSAGQDIRFTLADHTTTLNYDIEEWNQTGTSSVWVKLPSIAASSTLVIYMYYKNSLAVDGQTPSSTWNSYAGVWNLDKFGANYPDATGSGKTGVPQGAVADTTGAIGNAISLNGSSSLDVSYNLAQIIGRTSTFSAWLKTTQVGSNTAWQAPGITGVEQAGGGDDIFFGWISGSGTIRISSGNGQTAQSSFIVNDGTWRYVTMSRNETTGAVRFYVNGVLNGTGSSETGYKSTPFSQFGVIGDTGGAPNYLNGSLDGIRLSSTVLTDAQIRAEYKFSTDSNVTYGASEDL